MDTRRLGRTDHRSSLAILGGIAFHFTDGLDQAVALLRQAVDVGVNHLDIAPGYVTAEEKAGQALRETGIRLFVSCKSAATSASELRRELEQSLSRLGLESFDVYQLHGVVSTDDLDGRADAADELLRVRDEGLCRWVGITGHGDGTPAAQAEAVRRYDLDTVMFPVNPAVWSSTPYRADAEALLSLAAERDVGVMAIKAAAARPWTVGEEARHATTWYEPRTTPDDIAVGVHFALSTPGVAAFCTPGDLQLVGPALAAANAFTGMSAQARAAAIARAAGEPSIFAGI